MIESSFNHMPHLRRIIGFSLFLSAAVPQAISGVAGAAVPSRPKLLAKEVFMRHENGRPVVTGFVTYVSNSKPVLMHCFGREDYSDGYDDFAIQVSTDNGKTWSKPEIRWKSSVIPEGRMRYAEPAAYFDSEKQKLIVLIDHTLYPKDKLNVDTDYGLELNIYEPAKRKWTERRKLQFPGERTPAMSFSFPLKTERGHILFPGMRKCIDSEGKAIHYKSTWAPLDEIVTVIGDWGSGSIPTFRLGHALKIDPERSSRGLDENALIALSDGRVAAVCRGDNSAFPDQPGYKWLTFSSDEGEHWSAPVPFSATEGDPIESGANGSAFFRSSKNGKLYWLGNLALRGERAKGNWPRSPLCLVEVQETPLALKRDTIFAVDERTYNDSPRVQMSNFRFYQDRLTGDLVIFLSRYGEQSEKEWMLANYYRYRIELP
jgi:hypothetical protein